MAATEGKTVEEEAVEWSKGQHPGEVKKFGQSYPFHSFPLKNLHFAQFCTVLGCCAFAREVRQLLPMFGEFPRTFWMGFSRDNGHIHSTLKFKCEQCGKLVASGMEIYGIGTPFLEHFVKCPVGFSPQKAFHKVCFPRRASLAC